MDRKNLLLRARQWKRVLKMLEDDAVTMAHICDKHPWLLEEEGADVSAAPAVNPAKSNDQLNDNPLNAEVLSMLAAETGLASADAWWNVWWLVSKPEHDNAARENAFASDKKGVSLFEYAAALSYDWKNNRGVTVGLVGFTTGYNGKDTGDAMDLFKIYKGLGGEDLGPMAAGCTKSKEKCAVLVKKIQSLGSDPKWIEAQWRALFAPGGYLKKTVDTWKKVGVPRPSALAIATVFDCSLNQGHDGPHGGCVWLEKLAVKGDENATLEKFNAWRRTVAGTNNYNAPPVNGRNRADQFEALRKAGVSSLEGPKAMEEIKKAISWVMK